MSIPGSASPLFLSAAAAAAPAGFQVDRSLRFSSGDTPFLNRTPSSTGNRKTWTWSGWVKFANVDKNDQTLFSAASGNSYILFRFLGNDSTASRSYKLNYQMYDGSTNTDVYTERVLRDPSAWYHIVLSIDFTQSTANNRVKIYVNNELTTNVSISGGSPTIASQNTDTFANLSGAVNNIGRHPIYGEYFDGYLAEVHFIDGQALAPTDFGEEDSNGVWQPKAYSGTYGTNGFYLKFADNSSNAALGTDSSGNSNTWTVNNLSVTASGPAAGTFSGKDGISFDGIAAEVTLSSNTDVNPGSGVFTLECYAYAASGGNAEFGIYDGSPGGTGSFVLRRVGAGTLMVERHNLAFDITGASFSEDTWHHVAVTRDSSNNVRLFVDGTQSGSTSASNTHDYQGTFRLGRTNNAYTNGYISNLRLIKGTCLYTENFTAPTANLTNVTNTKLLMAQSTTSVTAATVKPSGLTISSAGGDGGAGIDSLIDTPTNYTAASGNNGGNHCTWNPLNTASNLALVNGNLDTTGFSGSSDAFGYGTIGVSSGKWYYEATPTTVVSAAYYVIGWGRGNKLTSNGSDEYMWFSQGALRGASTSSYGASWTAGDVIGVALDLDAGTLVYYKNGVSQGTAFTGITGTVLPKFGYWHGQGNFNFGQRPFAHTPPTGFLSLCTTNLDESAYASIADGSTAFDVDLWNGDGNATKTVTTSFSPGFVWAKSRTVASNHQLSDVVRGNGKVIFSNTNGAEGDYSTFGGGGISSLGTNQFVISQGSSTNNNLNQNNSTGVAWYWDAGASTVSNTDGSITSNVRVNQSAGFSIATYTGNGTVNSTVGHGLNAAPSLVIIKNRSNSHNWAVLHTSVGFTGTTLDGSPEYYMLQLDSSAARNDFTNDNIWNPTNSTFKINGEGTGNWVNANGDNYVAYSWAPVEGFSAFGSYTGNGSADGPFIYTGMRPAFLLVKSSSLAKSWYIFDSARNTFNSVTSFLVPDSSDAESSASPPDWFNFLSNGFKATTSNNAFNGNGNTYIYAAFAEHPLRHARAR